MYIVDVFMCFNIILASLSGQSWCRICYFVNGQALLSIFVSLIVILLLLKEFGPWDGAEKVLPDIHRHMPLLNLLMLVYGAWEEMLVSSSVLLCLLRQLSTYLEFINTSNYVTVNDWLINLFSGDWAFFLCNQSTAWP